MKEFIIDRSADFALCHIYQKEDPKQKFNHDSGGLEPNSLSGCQAKDAHIFVEKQKGGLGPKSLSSKVCQAKPDAHISVEKQKGGLEPKSLSGKHTVICQATPDAHISVEKQKGVTSAAAGIADAKHSGEKRKANISNETFFPNLRSLSFDFDSPIQRSLEKDDGTAEADAQKTLSKAVTPSSERRTREARPEM